MNRFNIYVLTRIILFALLLFLAAPHYYSLPFLFIAFVPLLKLAEKCKSTRSTLALGLAASVIATHAIYVGAEIASSLMWNYSTFQTILGFTLVAPIVQPQWIPFLLLRRLLFALMAKTKTNIPVKPIASALLFTLLDEAPWKIFGDRLGSFFIYHSFLSVWANLGGTILICFLVVLINELIAVKATKLKNGFRTLLYGIFVMVLGGLLLQMILGKQYPHEKRKVLIFQTGHAASEMLEQIKRQGFKDYDLTEAKRAIKNLEEVKSIYASEAFDLVVFPEGQAPGFLFGDGISYSGERLSLYNRFQELLKDLPFAVLTGVIFDRQGTGESYSYLINKGKYARSAKTLRFPYAEHIPGPEWFVGLVNKFFPSPKLRDTSRGAQLISWNGIIIGTLICYDAFYHEVMEKHVREGANLLVNITDDSWGGNDSGASLTFAFTAMRGIEAGLPLLRVSHTAVTALQQPDGRIELVLERGARAFSIVEMIIPTTPRKSFYMCLGGHKVLWMILFLMLLLLVFWTKMRQVKTFFDKS